MYLGLLQWLGDGDNGDYGNGFGMLIAMLIRNEIIILIAIVIVIIFSSSPSYSIFFFILSLEADHSSFHLADICIYLIHRYF